MPKYDYECEKCNRIDEKEHTISFSGSISCDVCGENLNRLITKTSFSLKGSGWFKDGYSSKKE